MTALLVAFILPAGYFISGYNHLSGTLSAQSEVDAFFVSRLISSIPNLWAYQTTRLEDILERRPRTGGAERRRILDSEGKVVAESPGTTGWPLISRRHSVFDSGRVVAELEITQSLRPLLLMSWFVAMGGAGLGAVLYYLLSILPIATARKAEEQLETANAELRAGNEDLRFFIFMLSHDLRTPLVSIQGFSGELNAVLKETEALIKRGFAGPLSREDQERIRMIIDKEIPSLLNFIRTGVERIHVLVNAVAKLSRVNQVELKPALLNMNATVRSALEQLSKEIEKLDVMVEVGELPAVFADRVAVQEIVEIIVDNAIKYRSPDRRGLVSISGEQNGQEIVIRIQDNGRGIAADDMPKVFGFFRRAGGQADPGEGMGLAYAKALMKRHDGRIWCESALGAGTTFSMAFPVNHQQ